MDNYEDIINLEYKKSTIRPHMGIEARSAQFAPFAALTGYDEAVKEAARTTKEKILIDDYFKEYLNSILQKIKENIKTKPKITVTYFVNDKKKSGGKYVTYEGNLKNIDEIKNVLIFEDKTKINIEEIISVSSKELNLDNEYY